MIIAEKSIIRPTFSYLGNFTISDSVFREIVEYLASQMPEIHKILRTRAMTICFDYFKRSSFGSLVQEMTSLSPFQ